MDPVCESTVPLSDLVKGYPKLSGQMGMMPETAIFRRFGALNAQNLIYLQAEIIYLEKKLRDLERSYSTSDGPESEYALSWFMLNRAARSGDDQQLKLFEEIRSKLKEYNRTLIDQSLVSALPEPDKLDLTYIQRYLATPEMGPLALSGRDYSVWGSTRYPDCRCPDLVALKPRQNQDQFSKWFTTIFVKLMSYGTRWIGNRSPTTGLRGIDDYRLLRATFWVTSVIASLLPVASISILYCVHSTPARMGLIAMFNLSVSVLLLKFTTAKRSEIFAVAAAFSAIQVVFVGTGGAAGGSGGRAVCAGQGSEEFVG